MSEIKEVVLSDNIDWHKPTTKGAKVPSAEGLAVTDYKGRQMLWIGLRCPDEHKGEFTILEYGRDVAQKDHLYFKYKGKHLVKVNPSVVNVNPPQVQDEHPFHLSGLCAAADGSLIVLGTTEDKYNEYYGNILYRVNVNTTDWKQESVGPKFALDQKAEGVVIWNENIGIVYDNDQKSVIDLGRQGQPSRLDIFPKASLLK